MWRDKEYKYISSAWNKQQIRSSPFFACEMPAEKKCWTIVFGVGTSPLISILLSWIHCLPSPDFTSGMCSYQPVSMPVQSIRMTLKSKISLMTMIETLPFWPYSYILWKVGYENTRYMRIILVANFIWHSGHAIRLYFPLSFSSLHYSCRRVFTVFYVTDM